MKFKIGEISPLKLPELNNVAELAIKSNAPLNNLTVCTRIAESLLYGALRKSSITTTFNKSSPSLPAIKISDKFFN